MSVKSAQIKTAGVDGVCQRDQSTLREEEQTSRKEFDRTVNPGSPHTTGLGRYQALYESRERVNLELSTVSCSYSMRLCRGFLQA